MHFNVLSVQIQQEYDTAYLSLKLAIVLLLVVFVPCVMRFHVMRFI